MGAREENIVRPRSLTVGDCLDVELRHSITDDGKGSVLRVISVECFRQSESFRSVRKSHSVDAVRLDFPAAQIDNTNLGGGRSGWSCCCLR